ncbi:MAG: L-arabinose isomerase [Oscillospiraceae bacterium]|nr:L-arabinose isomerase [Oscillospiraceae bacterium]
MKRPVFWFVVGSQHLYGPEVLDTVAARAAEMAAELESDGAIPFGIVCQNVVTTPGEALKTVREANYDDGCAGLIVWCHTFSPSKMWINGLTELQKPYLHLHTQYNRNIPDRDIDMDFMNLNQSAHGDREHGFIGARLRAPRKIVAGYWRDKAVREKIGSWMRSAAGCRVSRDLKVVRFGDNMRQVAVTEGDKVGAQIQLGWQVNTWPVGDLVREADAVAETEIDALVEEYGRQYTFSTDDAGAVRYQARVELAIQKILGREGAGAYTNTFEDLHGMRQLPGLASQRLMEQGYGYGGEGDWKVAAMTRVMKAMTEGMGGGTSFMEDYTYDLEPGRELSLGAHMLEVCPTLAAGKPEIQVHPLCIGGREPPARLVFEGKAGKAVVVSLIDMGGRLRLIAQDVECVKPVYEMPNLPVARVMWRAEPDLLTAAHAWLLAGGAHHTVLSYDATAEMMEDWAEMTGIEFVRIHKGTTIEALKKELFFADVAWKLR